MCLWTRFTGSTVPYPSDEGQGPKGEHSNRAQRTWFATPPLP